jgi:2,3-bisphosphoglycerate-independent phosphoglycerate mutase
LSLTLPRFLDKARAQGHNAGMASIKKISNKVLLVILDGFGINPADHGNAVKHAKKPNLNNLFSNYPFTTIEAGGESVGLPKGVVGNSEVGHMNLGAGRPVRQDLVRINECIEKKQFASLPLMQELISKAKSGTKRIHLMGLLSDGGVHSHINHIKEIVRVLSAESDLKVFLHAFMDGRDTARDCGDKYIQEIDKLAGIKIASIQGRSIGMDRDRRWHKIEQAYNMFTGLGAKSKLSASDYLKHEYAQGRFDEFVMPALLLEEGKMQDGDAIFFFNYRPDRAIQLTLCFTWDKFTEFERPVRPGYFLCMTPYVPDEVSLPILFDKEKISGGLSEYLSSIGKRQFKIAETEKYAHVTYFFNGGEKKPFAGEEHVLIPSPKEVATYDQKPSMSAVAVTDRLIEALKSNFDFYLVNFANCDMVGHTGNFDAAIAAVECVDECVGRLMQTCEKNNIAMILTADHGNSDQMQYEDGSPHTSHTGSPVPVALYHSSLKNLKLETLMPNNSGALKDIAPTVLAMLGIKDPPLFSGKPIFP